MKELRFLQTEVRADMSSGSPCLTGYAVKYGKRSRPIPTSRGSFVEVIKRGAFDRALRNTECVALVEHDPNRPLARMSSGLQLRSDSVGLSVRCPIDMRVSYAADLLHNVERGVIRNMSFGFTVSDGQLWDDEDEEGRRIALRTLTDVDELSDVSYVLNPAYPDSEADIDDGDFGDVDDRSSFLRSLFPEGVPELVETRSTGGIIVPNEFEARRSRMRKRSSMLLR